MTFSIFIRTTSFIYKSDNTAILIAIKLFYLKIYQDMFIIVSNINLVIKLCSVK
ncbi:hypothetical protein H6P87_00127 [Rickettsia tillamookensis]|uniref:Uncharacterized protein n=1 Tax=Rickettsia tillamookensis TaxID=2761623 RepID=A0A9E6SQ11_9RICK|nr:hypothetical protein H6P87_00127 [Rickettsia tillamookensis]